MRWPGSKYGVEISLMRRIFLAGLGLASFGFLSSAFAQDAKQDFSVVNRTGYELSHIYVAPTKSDDWGNDIMGPNTVPNGATVNVHFEAGTKTCRWDLKVTYSDDDSSAYWRNINLCEVERITIRYNRQTDTSTATFD